MKGQVKAFIERHFPALGAAYRKARDEWIYARARPYRSELGFTLHGDTSRHYTEGDAGADRLASDEVRRFEECLAGADAFVDIGANIGVFSLLAARAGKPVVAIEAHPRNHQNLLRNLEANGFPKVECHLCALSDGPGLAPLFGSGEMASLTPGWGGKAADHQQLVAMNTLDHLLAGRFPGQRLLVKLDVEGHEHAVLRGARETLARSPRPTWLFEHGYDQHFGGSVNPHYFNVFEAFWSNGYQVAPLEEPNCPLNPDAIRAALARGKNPCPGGLNYLAQSRAPENDQRA